MKHYLPKTSKCFIDKLFTSTLTTILKVIKLNKKFNKKILLAISTFLFLIALVSLVFALGPVITIGSPANNTILPSSTTSVNIEIYTDVPSICKYDTSSESFVYETSNDYINYDTASTNITLPWNVTSGNNYNFYYKCNNSGIVNDASTYHTFSVANPSDTTAPVISNVINATQATNNVTIAWDTDENANSAVYYGFTTVYGSTTTDVNYLTSHSVLLTGLTTGGVLYHYKVGSCDATGNCANSSDYNFTTVSTAAGGGGVADSIDDTLQEGETKTYTLDGTNYTVTLSLVTDTGTIQAKFIVNEETTSSLKINESFIFSDNSKIKVLNLLPNEAGDITQDSAMFILYAYVPDYSTITFTLNTIVKTDNSVNSSFVVGDSAPASDIIAAADMMAGLEAYGNFSFGAMKLASEIADQYNEKLILTGNRDNNPLTSSLVANWPLSEGEGLIKVYKNEADGYVNLVVAGSTELDTRIAANVVSKYQDYATDLNCDTVKVTGTQTDLSDLSLECLPSDFMECPWPEVGNWIVNGDDVVSCNNKNITLTGIDYEVTVSSLTDTQAEFIVNGEATGILNEGGMYVLSDGSNIQLNSIHTDKSPIGVEYCINSYFGDGFCALSPAGETETVSLGGNLYVDSNANFTLNNSALNLIGATFEGDSVNIIENSVINNSEAEISYRWNSNNIIIDSTFYGPSRFDENSINTIDNSLFCEYAGFIGNSVNKISNSRFGVNCPKETVTYTDKETGEEVTEDVERGASVTFSADSNSKITNSVFNNSYLEFRENSKIAFIDSTIYKELSLITRPYDNMTIKDVKPGIVNSVISSAISPFELNLTNTQIEGMGLNVEVNSTNKVINSVLYYAHFNEDSANLIKNSTINTTYFDPGTDNTIENSSFDELNVYENSVTSITDSTIDIISIISDTNDLAINSLRQGTINTNIGSIIITNTGISNFILLFAGNTVNSLLNSDILGLFTGDSYFMDYSGVSTATSTTIENSDIGVWVTGGDAINKAYNSTFNSTRYNYIIKEETGNDMDMYSIFSDSNNTIENSNFYGKISLVDNASFNFANATVENIYGVGSEYKRCLSTETFVGAGATTIVEAGCISWEYLIIKGALNITNKTIGAFYGNTSLTRYYPIYIDAIGPVVNKLVSIKDNGNLVWSGTTDSNGYAEAVLVFDNYTYNNVYDIVIDNVVVDSISLTKDTPIKYTIPVIYNLVNSSITDTNAAISWNTNKIINAKLYYGLTKAYENSITNETLSATHSFDITGLLPNMLYQYKAESCDEVNYCAVSYGNFITLEPVDATAPVISNIAVSSITTSSAAISWDTDEGATAQLEYGTTTAYGKNTTFDARLITSHSFTLSGLDYNTKYYYKINSYDGVGNLATAESSFTTLNDATAPVISNVQAKEVYEDGAYLYAETNEESWYDPDWAESNVLIDYGENESYGRTSIAGEISHSEGVWRYGMIYHINYFKPNTTYYYRFAAKDKAGNVAYSAGYTFITSYTEPPVNETAVCLYSGNCWVNEQCYDSGATNPENYLQYCDSNKTQAAWSYKAPQFDSVTAWLGDTAGTQPIFYAIVDASQPVSIRGTATPIPGDTRTLFFSPLNATTNIYSTNVVVGANRDVSYKLYITNAGGETAEFSGLVESIKPNLIVRQSDNRRGDNSKFKNQTVYIPDNKTLELPLNGTLNSRLLLKTDSEILKKAEVVDVFPINNPSAYASLPAANALDSFEINLTFDNSTTNLTYCVSYAGFNSIDENTIEAYKLIGSSWNKIDSTKNTTSKEICANVLSAQTPYMFGGETKSDGDSSGGGSGGGSSRTTPTPAPKPTQLIKEVLDEKKIEEKTKEETISLFGEGKRPSLKERISKITGAVTGFDGPISSVGYIAMLSVIIVGLGAYTFYDRRRCY